MIVNGRCKSSIETTCPVIVSSTFCTTHTHIQTRTYSTNMFECMYVHEGANTLNTYHFTSVYSGWQCADVLLSSRYDLVKNNVRWFEAQMYCQSHYRAKLVMIANRADQLRLQAYLETIEGQTLRCLVLCSHKVQHCWSVERQLTFRWLDYLQAKLNVVSFSRRLRSKYFTQWLNSQSHRHEAMSTHATSLLV